MAFIYKQCENPYRHNGHTWHILTSENVTTIYWCRGVYSEKDVA